MYMNTFTIKQIEGLIKVMSQDYKKLIAVIKSMKNSIEIPATRKYIDLYYKKNGDKQKEMIEYYFKVKRKGLHD